MDKKLFQRVESARKRMKMSRSQFLAQAAREVLNRQGSQNLTESYNEVYGKNPMPQEEKDFIEAAAASLFDSQGGEQW